MRVNGWLQHAGSSKRSQAVMAVDAEGRVALDDNPVGSAAALEYSDRIGNTRRFVALPNGASFETDDNDAVDTIVRRHVARRSWLHLLESSGKWAVAALLVLAVAGWSFFSFGLPPLSERVAHWVPVSVAEQLGEGVINAFDSKFDESDISASRQTEIQTLFRSLIPEDSPFSYRLHIKASKHFGSNAFALPDGSVFITDDLIELADNLDQIEAVLHHEIAHVELRHGLQQLLRASVLTTVVYSLTGDASGLGTLVAAAPAILVQAKYSREMETEADLYAIRALHRSGTDPIVKVQILEKLQADLNKFGSFSYLMSHPMGDARLKPLHEEIDALASQ
ncbi:MAG: M48 family metallopeptidase [Pseudomonadota bacterium]